MSALINKIMDSDNWPCIKNPETLELINEMADNAFIKGDFNSKFAAMLMYHQIIETMCIHILDNCNFYIQLALYPVTLDTALKENKMLGYYLDEMKNSISFDYKDDFISKIQDFNSVRNNCVHRLIKTNIADIEKQIDKIKSIFDKIYELYDTIQDNFRVDFHNFKKDVFMDLIDDEDE